jgi:hypothetical protein
MYKTRIAPFFRLTALGLTVSMVGVTLAPLAHAQAAASGPGAAVAKPAKPAPEKAAKPEKAVKAAEAKAAAGKPLDAKPAADATLKPPEAKQPDKKTRDTARKAYGQGEKVFGENNFSAAYDAFIKADSLIPAPHSKYWIAKCLDKQDKTEDAISAYTKFLADPEAARVGDEKLADAKTRLDELKAKMVEFLSVVTVPAGAVVSVDGAAEPGVTPLTVKLTPGTHKLTVSSTGFVTQEVEVTAKAGEKSERKVELPVKPPPPPPAPLPVAETPAPPPPPPPPPEKRSLVPAYVTLGIAGAGAIVGSIFGVKALSAKSDFNKAPTTSKADDTERNALISDMAFGVAITLGVTGIVLLTSEDDSAKESAKQLTKSPYKLNFGAYAGKDRGGASARLTF